MKSLHRRGLTTTLAIGVGVLMLAGCSTGSSGSPSPTATEAAVATASTAPADTATPSITPAELAIWGYKGPGLPQEACIAEINAAFEAANPGITIAYEAIGAGGPYETKVQTEFLGGNGPDVVMAQGSQLLQLAENGYFKDLSSQPWAGDVVEGVKPFVSYDGTLYALPIGANGLGLMANMDVLGKAGVTEIPSDWPSFLAALEKLKAADLTPLALPDKNGWTGVMTFLSLGATLVPTSWGDEFYNGTTDFAAWKPVLDQMVELDSKGYVDWKSELGVDEFAQGLGNFEEGETGFWLHGDWNMPPLNEKGVNVQFTALPGGGAGVDPSVLTYAGGGWAINKDSENVAAAEKYLEFFASPESMSCFLKAEGALSTLTTVPSPETEGTAPFKEAYAAGRYMYMPTTTWFAGDVQTQIGSKLQELFLGSINVEETIQALNGIGVKKS